MTRVLYVLAELNKYGVSVSVNGDKLKLHSTQAPPPALLELLKNNKDAVLTYLSGTKTIPRLPWQLERLIASASQNSLAVKHQGVLNPNAYTLNWAAAYLYSDRSEALQRLWEIYETQEVEQKQREASASSHRPRQSLTIVPKVDNSS